MPNDEQNDEVSPQASRVVDDENCASRLGPPHTGILKRNGNRLGTRRLGD